MQPEKRFRLGAAKIELRASGDGTQKKFIVGHAAVWDQWTTLYDSRYWLFREVIRRGAFTACLKEGADVRSLFNHDPNFILGRTKSGTLVITQDEIGLYQETDPPDTQTIRDLVVAPIGREDVDGMSFAFSCRRADRTVETENADGSCVIDRGGERITIRYEGEKLVEEREVIDADLFDVSPVVFPAYVGTDVALRSALFGIADRVKEMDRPHTPPRRQAPVRDEIRRWLDSGAGVGPKPAG
jgi:HK97 family phage prohead protease